MKDKKAVAAFLLITAVLSVVCYFVIILGGDAAGWVTYILMWCPGIAVLITARIFYRGQKILGFHKFKIKYFFLSMLIPAIYLGLSYGVYWIYDRSSLGAQASAVPLPQLLISSVVTFLVGSASSCLPALGEEIGWRGFLLPKMAEIWNVKIAVVLSGAIWAVWHFPLMLAGVYQAGTPVWYQLPIFTIELVAMTAILAYLRLKSGSVWPAVFFHASHNVVDQAILRPLSAGEDIVYFAGETGIITVVLVIVITVILFRMSKGDMDEQAKAER